MADGLSLIPASVLRNLADKLYEKRKNAALEIEGIVKQLALAGEHEKISAVINLLTVDFACSPQANQRKGGLIGLAAATVGLAAEAAQHLEQIVPPVLNSFTDHDGRVRYYACEALYNIAKVVRGDFIFFFNKIFDALCKLSADADPNVQSAAHLLDRLIKDIVTESDQFSIEEFIPLLRERMNVLNPYVRQFLVGWITVLDSVPDIDMLGFLPDFLDGLFNMLSDSSHEIRQQADSALSEFLQEIKNSPNVDYGRMAEILVQRAGSSDEFTRLTAITWINEFVKLGGEQLVPYYADILGAILPCISDKEEKIRVVARETNEELRAIRADPADGFNIDAILSIARRELTSEWEATRIEALHWISALLARYRSEVISYLNHTFDSLLNALSDSSNEVVLLALEVHACIAEDNKNFWRLVGLLVRNFQNDRVLLERRGALIVRRLCVLLDAERVYRQFSLNLEQEEDLDFASVMVQAYNHASSVIQSLREEDINAKFLVQLDKLIRLLETPIFAYLRLQLLEPGKYTWLLKTLYGLLMMLPQQSAAFKILRTRLKTVPSYSCIEQLKGTSSENPYSQILQFSEDNRNRYAANVANVYNAIDFPSRLQQFEQMQHKHRMHSKSKLQSRNSTPSIASQSIEEEQLFADMALLTDLIKLNLSDYTEKIIAEYIWVGGSGVDLRSKARTLSGPVTDPSQLPKWNYDGSSTGQAPGEDSEVILYPQAIFKDPFRKGNNILVMCDCYTPQGEPIPTNKRHNAAKIFSNPAVAAEEAWFGIEQEYTLLQKDVKWPIGWPIGGYPGPQGPYYCSAGADKAFGRDVVDAHYKACLYAGIDISGINGEVMPGQWEFQVGPCVGISAGDQLWVARYVLEPADRLTRYRLDLREQRITEMAGVVLSLDPKPIQGDWNGAGAHTNYSTKSMRSDGGYGVIKEAIEKLGRRHKEHIAAYGEGNERRLTGRHETADIDTFVWGVANRGASIRVGRDTEKSGKGYFEDRRPASNMDPYVVTSMIAETTILWKPT
ncbi:hypothetical protein MUK42_15831 [Musa troglodytarum]|uniref:glutamine synthetase n=1 Tax=Musa troglodytarum TaxID=320322 RepID=A0A9E7KQH7_9LILI|nr:hypothetical protein MUK42_15831 [Musa troglodytarum]